MKGKHFLKKRKQQEQGMNKTLKHLVNTTHMQYLLTLFGDVTSNCELHSHSFIQFFLLRLGLIDLNRQLSNVYTIIFHQYLFLKSICRDNVFSLV